MNVNGCYDKTQALANATAHVDEAIHLVNLEANPFGQRINSLMEEGCRNGYFGAYKTAAQLRAHFRQEAHSGTCFGQAMSVLANTNHNPHAAIQRVTKIEPYCFQMLELMRYETGQCARLSPGSEKFREKIQNALGEEVNRIGLRTLDKPMYVQRKHFIKTLETIQKTNVHGRAICVLFAIKPKRIGGFKDVGHAITVVLGPKDRPTFHIYDSHYGFFNATSFNGLKKHLETYSHKMIPHKSSIELYVSRKK